MNKNGEKEGKRSKGQKKDNKLPKVNKTRGSDNKVSVADKVEEADDISNKFPNFSVLTEEERLVFFQALTAARKNVERRGVPTRDRFGTVHDEYLKYFDQDDKKEEPSDDLSTSLKSNSVLESSVNASRKRSTVQFDAGEPSEELTMEKSRSPTLLLEGTSETPREGSDLVTVEPGLLAQCESVIQEDTDKVVGLYLKKKKRNDAKSSELRTENKKPDQGGERKTSKATKKEPAERETKRKENAWTVQLSGAAPKSRETPRFDELNPEERDIFFDILQEARNNIVEKNPNRKSEILPLDAIVRRYCDRPPKGAQNSPKGVVGRRNLRVKVNLTSGDNERLLKEKTKCEDQSDPDLKQRQRRYSSSELPPPQDLGHEEGTETEIRGPVEEKKARETGKRSSKGELSNDSSLSKIAHSLETVDIKMSPGMKNVRSEKNKASLQEIKRNDTSKKGTGKTKASKTSSYFTEIHKSYGSLRKDESQTGKNTSALSKSGKVCRGKKVVESGKKKKKEKKKKQEEMEKEESQDLFPELSFQDLLNDDKSLEDDEEEEEEKEDRVEAEEPSWTSICPECEFGSEDTCESAVQPPPGRSCSETCTLQMSSMISQMSEEIPRNSEMETEESKESVSDDKEDEEAEDEGGGTATEKDEGGRAAEEEDEGGGVATEKDEGGRAAEEEDEGGRAAAAEEDEGGRAAAAEEDEGGRAAEEEDSDSVDCPAAGVSWDEGTLGPGEVAADSWSLNEGGSGGSEESAGGSMEEGSTAERFQNEGTAREFAGVSASPKVMIVDDNVIEKIRKLIYYLEAKAGKEGRLEKEYIKLLVDYVDYLSKVLEALVQKKGNRKQVQSTYPAEVQLNFDGAEKRKDQKDEAAKTTGPDSVSRQREPSGVEGDKGTEKTAKDQDAGSISMMPSESENSIISEEETNYVPPSTSTKKVVATKIRLLQDLLKKRAEFVQGSADELRIVHLPEPEYVPEEKPLKLKLITEDEDENQQTARNMKFIRALIGCFTCGKKKEEEEGIFENLKGEAVRVDVCEAKLRDPANATLNQSTMEVLKAAGRKRIIEKYYNKG